MKTKTSSDIYDYTDFSRDYLDRRKEYASVRRIAFVNKIIKNIFDEIVNEVILKKEVYRLAGANFKVVRIERDFSKLAVNWGETEKKKKEILSRGGKLATKISETKDGKPIFDDGEKYMVYFTDDFYTTLLKVNVNRTFISKNSTFRQTYPVIPEIHCWHFMSAEKSANVRLHEAERTNVVNKFDYPCYDRKRKNSFI